MDIENSPIILNDNPHYTKYMQISAFKLLCEEGNLLQAKLLYNQLNEGIKIDLHVDIESIFQQLCRNGRLEMAKWLIKNQ